MDGRAAAMAVATGMAECVVVWRAVTRLEFRMGGTGRAAPDVIEFQYQTPYWRDAAAAVRDVRACTCTSTT